jgi:SAM-dependent methyltransferase
VRRTVTAAVEYGVARAGTAAVRVLDRDVVGQAHHPRGAAGYVTAWEMAHRPSNRLRSRWVVSLLDVRPDSRILEIGFGPGIAVQALVRAGAAHVYGIDHSGVMLRRASRRNAAAIRAGRVTLVEASVERIPPALDGPFDAIVAVNALGFLARARRAARRAARTAGARWTYRHRVPAALSRRDGGDLPAGRSGDRGPAHGGRLRPAEHPNLAPGPAGGLCPGRPPGPGLRAAVLTAHPGTFMPGDGRLRPPRRGSPLTVVTGAAVLAWRPIPSLSSVRPVEWYSKYRTCSWARW